MFAVIHPLVLEQRRDDLELRQKELDDATRVADEIESRLTAVRNEDVSLKAELIEAKNEFENLKSQDMKNSQALEQAQQQADKLLNKVSYSLFGVVATVPLYLY